ncbi:MAG: diacylglycerol kinase [Butyricicoccus sp.]
MNHEIRKLRQSFGYALKGFRACMRTERNFRIHLTAAVYVSLFALLGGLDATHYAVLCLCFALMMAAELLNTAIERLCDRMASGYDELVGQAKDIAAAAVFLCALFCAVIGAVFFLPSGALLRAVGALIVHPWRLGLFLLSLPVAAGFVFCFGKRTRKR